MGTAFWIKRFLVVLAGAFVLICAAQLLRGHELSYSATQAGIWSTIAATIFIVTRLVRARRGQHCELCRDTPQMNEDASGDS